MLPEASSEGFLWKRFLKILQISLEIISNFIEKETPTQVPSVET